MTETPRYVDLRCGQADGVAHIELHRPQALNAWTPAMGRELLDAVRRASADPGVRSVLITGAAPASLGPRSCACSATGSPPRPHWTGACSTPCTRSTSC